MMPYLYVTTYSVSIISCTFKLGRLKEAILMKIYSSPICPFVQRVNAVLEAKNVQYEVEYLDLMNLPDWFLKILPNAEVPVLVTDNNVALFESFAICEYLEERPDLNTRH
jgi:glutathione S-transferase